MKGRWSTEWGTLQNYDNKTQDTGTKYKLSEKWAKEKIILTCEFIYNSWIERNNSDHDTEGDLVIRKKQKIIEIIIGESEKLDKSEGFKKEDLERVRLMQLPIENLQRIELNQKNAKKRQNKKRRMLHK
jgi:hypothetical protein